MKRLIIILSMLVLSLGAEAKLTPNRLFSDGMVLQQNSSAKIWGTADAGSTVTASTSWNGKRYSAKADSEGRWELQVSTPAASYTPYSVTLSGAGEKVVIKDVLIGEVWFASGQSNMEMPMRGFYNCPVEGAADYISAAPARDKIRMFTVPIVQTNELRYEVEGQWAGADQSTIKAMSATAFFFAHKLNSTLDVPIGIVSCARGGSRVESWLPREILESYPDIDLTPEGILAETEYTRPMQMYNGMLNPVKGYTVKGFIWYQGCSNVYAPQNFTDRMLTMIEHWRGLWGDDDNALPFYTVEIAPYRYRNGSDNASLLRLAQHEVAAKAPNCGIVVTNDLVAPYEMDNIHPADKKSVGHRLAYLALNRDYGMYEVACKSPEAVEVIKVPGCESEIGVVLTDCPNGLDRWLEIEGLEVAGPDGDFHPVTFAYFEWEPKYLRVRSEFVHNPVQVRYGWGDFNPGNLKNSEGLPVSPFWLKMK